MSVQGHRLRLWIAQKRRGKIHVWNLNQESRKELGRKISAVYVLLLLAD
jgi:hypothetical protein